MKKLTTLFLLALLPLMVNSATLIDGINYVLNTSTKEAMVTSSYPYYTGSVTIPSTVTYDGITYSVTSIESYAFNYCTDLTAVTIPKSVTSIGSFVFNYCSKLNSITVESGNPQYDSRDNCNAIIETASNKLIIGCNGTVIPNGVTAIGATAFPGSQLASITIPQSVTSIHTIAFEKCPNLSSVTVANGNTKYDSRDNCNAIIETATNTLVTGCKNTLIPNSVTSIGHYAFSDCENMTEITIPNSVTSIGNGAFRNCSKLTSVTIPNSVTKIGSQAFYRCYNLTEVTIPNNVTSIGSETFSNCYGLTEVTIPNSVTYIGARAFVSCSRLTSVTIPNSVTEIGGSAFSFCGLLTEVYCYPEEVPTTATDAFESSYLKKMTLYVPDESAAAYTTTEPWKSFGTIKTMSGETPEIPETPKCATPTISFAGGKLQFSCDTEDVEYVSHVEMPTSFDGNSDNVTLPTIKVTVYATKEGYENSDVATKEINVGGSGGVRGDVNLDGEVGMPDVMFIVNYILNGKFPEE